MCQISSAQFYEGLKHFMLFFWQFSAYLRRFTGLYLAASGCIVLFFRWTLKPSYEERRNIGDALLVGERKIFFFLINLTNRMDQFDSRMHSSFSAFCQMAHFVLAHCKVNTVNSLKQLDNLNLLMGGDRSVFSHQTIKCNLLVYINVFFTHCWSIWTVYLSIPLSL